jgi:hypothetical protein
LTQAVDAVACRCMSGGRTQVRLASGTTYARLFEIGEPQPGETVLVAAGEPTQPCSLVAIAKPIAKSGHQTVTRNWFWRLLPGRRRSWRRSAREEGFCFLPHPFIQVVFPIAQIFDVVVEVVHVDDWLALLPAVISDM